MRLVSLPQLRADIKVELQEMKNTIVLRPHFWRESDQLPSPEYLEYVSADSNSCVQTKGSWFFDFFLDFFPSLDWFQTDLAPCVELSLSFFCMCCYRECL